MPLRLRLLHILAGCQTNQPTKLNSLIQRKKCSVKRSTLPLSRDHLIDFDRTDVIQLNNDATLQPYELLFTFQQSNSSSVQDCKIMLSFAKRWVEG